MKSKSIESRSGVALGNMKILDLIILPAAFTKFTTALRPFVITIVFGERDETFWRAEDQIRRHILVNDTGYTVTALPVSYYM
jgi:hypothetical protein